MNPFSSAGDQHTHLPSPDRVDKNETNIPQVQNESFLSERKDDPRIKSREKSLQEFDQAYWKWREIVDNAEEGIKFYNSFGEMLGGFKGGCIQFLNSRRVDVGYVLRFFSSFILITTFSPPFAHYS